MTRKRNLQKLKDQRKHYERFLKAILHHAHDNDNGFKVYNIAHAGLAGRMSPWVKYPKPPM